MQNEKPEFWETAFTSNKEMWGFEPTNSAMFAKDFFLEKSVNNILIPGIGYGRNAKVFLDNYIKVTGIEISQTAITMARKHYGEEMVIYHGSATAMPFDQQQYDGVFCHAVIHLFSEDERKKLISDCYNQMQEGGYLIFTAISKQAQTYGTGKELSKDRFEQFNGVTMFFYDENSIKEEFVNVGLQDIMEIQENYPFHLVICKK